METVNDSPNFGSSSVKLPPAAFRLGTLDFDPSGNPYYKFPPFLSTPNDTPLIPFHEFEAKGIVICLEADAEEVDGEGIRTVELGTKHGGTGDPEKRKRKKRSKLDLDSRKGPWWEEWGEGEDLRRADCFDPNTSRGDRFTQGAYDFQQNRRWTPVLQSLYDHFRHYCGLLGHATKNERYGRGKGGGDDNDDDEDDEEELIAEQERQSEQTNPLPKPFGDADQGPKIHEIDAEYEAELEAKEMKMDAFLNDPEGSTKIFFSSYYKDKGLFWSEPKLRDGPILLSFFFGFFIRNKIMPDYEKVFRKAHKVAELARLELPQTTKISMAIPDAFGGGCVSLWGSKLPVTWSKEDAIEIDGTSWSNPTPAPVQEWQEALREQGVEQVGASMNGGVQETSSTWAPKEGIETVPIMGGWGDSATVLDDGVDMWGAPGGTTDWTLQEEKPCLMKFFGPTTIPLTHTTQLVEKSTRQIMAIAPPDTNDKGLGGTLGTVFLAPWKNPKEGETTILPPELLSDLPEGSTFDMGRDVVKVFADPKAIEVMREGMGLHAVFVQVVEIAGSTAEVKGKKHKSRNKGKSKTKGFDDKEWWYIEFLYEVVPSFWTEEGE